MAALLLETAVPDESPVSDRGSRALGYLDPNEVLNGALHRAQAHGSKPDAGLIYFFVDQDRGPPEIWNPVRDLYIDDREFHRALDRFEYLRGAQYVQLMPNDRPPVPLAVYRRQWQQLPNGATEIENEARAQKLNWGPLRAGLFQGDPELFWPAAVAYDESVAEAARSKRQFLD